MSPDLGQWVGTVLLLAAATVVAIWGTRRTDRATTDAWDADVDRCICAPEGPCLGADSDSGRTVECAACLALDPDEACLHDPEIDVEDWSLPVHDAAVEAIRARARAVAAGEIGIAP